MHALGKHGFYIFTIRH